MPELPDVAVYVERLEDRLAGRKLERVRLLNPFVLRSVTPPLSSVEGRKLLGVRRIGKRIVFELEGGLFLVLHLMIAGRLRWLEKSKKPPGRISLAVFEFQDSALVLTEAGTKRRASIHVVEGEAALAAMDPGGLEVLEAGLAAFAERLKRDKHTVKRALTDPHLFSGIGNAYSDEILHRAKLSPFAQTSSLSEEDVKRLFDATRSILIEWTERLRKAAGADLPEKVTAFHEEMAVHGRWRKPCPVCGSPVQRIVYAENETNYCARCQTGGRILADRALSRLLKASWPRSIDELG
ncbi:MAG TPA: DNA-formamidopyrimidine glycosylase family protein [Burkholderiales bacterium]|nr:DNA-formamidopyrimidine glycosylase family protein [Burkholderiales bacterium]